jgi:UDP-glucose 4-epimerase
MKTILITGVAGLLGSRLAKHLYDKGYTVVGIDDLSGGYEENLNDLPNSKAPLYINTINDSTYLHRVLNRHKPDVVYHFAAYAAECVSPFMRNFNYTNNLVATANVVNACINHDVGRLVFASSMAVYGAQEAPFREDMPYAPIDPYGVAKAAAEQDIRIAGEQHGLDWCIIRPHNVYGRNQNIWDNYRNVLGIWMRRTLAGQPMIVYGDGLQTRAFSCMDDSLEPLERAGFDQQCSRQIINLGGTEETSLIDAAHTLRDVMGMGHITHMEPRHEVKHSSAAWQKSVDLLGFEHKTNLYEGLTDMWAWAKEQPSREQFVWEQFEVEKELYSYWKPEFLKGS